MHCTDSDDSLDIGRKEINDWHKQRGWLSPSGVSCGYHYIIRRNGHIEHGRPPHELGAGVKGENKDSIHVVWVGRKEIAPAQLKSLQSHVKRLLDAYDLEIVDVYGHYEFNLDKTCPNLDMNKFRAELLFIWDY